MYAPEDGSLIPVIYVGMVKYSLICEHTSDSWTIIG
jgi:hypothetical protein